VELLRLCVPDLDRAVVEKRASHEESTGRPMTVPSARRRAAASTTFKDAMAPSLKPNSFSRSGGADIVAAKVLNSSSSLLASGLVSRRGIAMNSSSSISS